MFRLMLSDGDWERFQEGFRSVGIYRTCKLRMTVEGILWRMRVGSPWRDLPTEFGPWSTIYNQYNRWSEKGILPKLFAFFCKGIDSEWQFMDGTIVRAHQHSAGARRGEEIAIGSSRGGKTTKIHMLADAHGNPVFFEITEGQVHDMQQSEALLEHCKAGGSLINDKGYDSEKLREKAREKEITPVIPRRKNSEKPNPEFDQELYKLRHLVENLFAKLKQFRGLATRFDKLKRNFASVVYLACITLWIRL